MVKFLIDRPIAVLMTFVACFIVGLAAYFSLPVSLLPDIDIPQITVQVSGENFSARELENTMVAPVRRQLMQVSGLSELRSETRDGQGIIRLSFEFGTDTDLAFIEVNEKIDAAMNSFPRDAARPKAIKASATDIPVFYLNMTLAHTAPSTPPNGELLTSEVPPLGGLRGADETAFLQMCELAENVVKRRIEQLPQVAMADMTGVPQKMLRIVPDLGKMESLGMGIADLEKILQDNNVEPGSMLVRDGYYEYNIRIASILRTPADVEDIYFSLGGRVMQLKEICGVKTATRGETGRSLAGGKRAVTLAIIKQGEENMDNLRKELRATTDHFARIYPDIEFSIARNQTELLDYTISNLRQNFTLGFLFIFVVAIFFMGDVRSPLVIGICMIASVVITFFLFRLCHISLNVISLSGLILAVGMMIDNAIIVTENVSQYRERGYLLRRAAVAGTSEMITPMLSSSLTTIAVFVPLVFMSGIAGAIFMDEAFSITSGLMISYLTGIMLLPVLYVLFYRVGIRRSARSSQAALTTKKGYLTTFLLKAYDKGIEWTFSHRKLTLAFALLSLPVCVLMFGVIGKERMPEIDQNETVVSIEWNENIHVEENHRRVNAVLAMAGPLVEEHTAYVGMQDYILGTKNELSSTEAELYFKTAKPEQIPVLNRRIESEIHKNYPDATVTFSPPATIFEKLFVTGEPDLVAQLRATNQTTTPTAEEIRAVEGRLNEATGHISDATPFRSQLNMEVDREKLLIYNVSYDEVSRTLRTALRDNQVSTLRSFQQYLPIGIAGREMSVNRILSETLVETAGSTATGNASPEEKQYVPLRELVRIVPDKDLKEITAGRGGEYIPLNYYDVEDVPALMGKIRKTVDGEQGWDMSFSGSYFSNQKMMGELCVILLISVLLMYFILCAQFESFVQPLIVLAEIPMDIAFGLVLLWAAGYTLNLMSAIGIIVSCGIVVNDSILKLDSINELRRAGMPLWDAIHTAGHRRLRAIVMTTLTTVFAMVPLLFTSDLGSELQRPLSVAMIATMLVGLVISLFVIPLIYWYIYRNKVQDISDET